jgi:hypothetical protein
MEHRYNFSHDKLDALVALVIGWFVHAPAATGDVAFSDEWERKQIARELHWN